MRASENGSNDARARRKKDALERGAQTVRLIALAEEEVFDEV